MATVGTQVQPASPALSDATTVALGCTQAGTTVVEQIEPATKVVETAPAPGVAVSGAAGVAAAEETVFCPSCKQYKPVKEVYQQEANELTDTKKTNRCRKCNSLKQRIRRIINTGAVTDHDIADMDADARAELFAQGADLFQGDLKKLLVEKVTHSKVVRASQKVQAVGDFVPVESLKAKILAKPDGQADWEKYEEHGIKVTHGVTGKTLMWDPEYKMDISNTDESEISRSRVLEQSQEVKPSSKRRKVEKARKDDQTPAEATGGSDENKQPNVPPKPKSLSAGLIKRLNAAIPKLEQDTLQLSALLLQALAPEAIENFVPKTVKAAEQLKNKFTESVGKLKKIQEAKAGDSKEINSFLKEVNTMKAQAKTVCAEFKQVLDEMEGEEEE